MKSLKTLSLLTVALAFPFWTACGGDTQDVAPAEKKVTWTEQGYSVEAVSAAAAAKQCVGEIKCVNSTGITVVSCTLSNTVCGARCPTGYTFSSGTCDFVTPTPTPNPPTPSN